MGLVRDTEAQLGFKRIRAQVQFRVQVQVLVHRCACKCGSNLVPGTESGKVRTRASSSSFMFTTKALTSANKMSDTTFLALHKQPHLDVAKSV